MSVNYVQIGRDKLFAPDEQSVCTVEIFLAQPHSANCRCRIIIDGEKGRTDHIVGGGNWYQAMIEAGKFLRRYLSINYQGFTCDGVQGSTPENVYPQIVNPYYGIDLYNDVSTYMEQKIQIIESELTGEFGKFEDDK